MPSEWIPRVGSFPRPVICKWQEMQFAAVAGSSVSSAKTAINSAKAGARQLIFQHSPSHKSGVSILSQCSSVNAAFQAIKAPGMKLVSQTQEEKLS